MIEGKKLFQIGLQADKSMQKLIDSCKKMWYDKAILHGSDDYAA